jgi:hypothetical protein
MSQNDPADQNTQVSANSDQPAQMIDVQKIAEKIMELLKHEARIERERTGRH